MSLTTSTLVLDYTVDPATLGPLTVPTSVKYTGAYDIFDVTLNGSDQNDNLQAYAGPGSWRAYNTANPTASLTVTNVLIGGALDDILTSSTRLSGLTKEQQTTLYSRADTLRGGAGDDTYYIRDNNVTIEEDSTPEGGQDLIILTSTFLRLNSGTTFDMAAGVENLQILSSIGAEVSGSDLDNTIIGGDGDDAIYGGEGFDKIQGKLGADFLAGGGGDDLANGGAGDDNIYVGTGQDTVLGGAGNDRLYGDEDADRLSGGTGDDGLYGGSEADTLFGGAGVDGLNGGEGADLLRGDDGADYILGDTGDDTVQGGTGDDTLSGYDGFDILSGGDDMDVLYGGENEDLLYGGAGSDSVSGEEDSDTLDGGAGADGVFGDGGADLVLGGDGDDNLFGGEDNDTVRGGAGDEEAFGDGGDDVISGGDGADTLYGSLDNDMVYGGNDNDDVYGDEGDDLVSGGAGDNNVFGGDGNDTLLSFDATSADTLEGGIGNDYYIVDSANDRVADRGGDIGGLDTLASGTISLDESVYGTTYIETLMLTGGSDLDITGASDSQVYQFIGNTGNNQITVKATSGLFASYGDKGDDTINGSDGGNDSVEGGIGKDSLLGFIGDDSLYGGDDADVLDGGEGFDYLDGGDGDDLFVIDSPFDTVIDSLGNDTVSSATMSLDENVFIFSNVFIESLELSGADGLSLTGGNGGMATKFIGNDGDNEIALTFSGQSQTWSYGGDGNDTLLGSHNGDDYQAGGNGNDQIEGGNGADTLLGGTGEDSMTGGNDADHFVFADIEGTTFNSISDFEIGVDKIDLTALNIQSIYSEAFGVANYNSETGFIGGGVGSAWISGEIGAHDVYVDSDGNNVVDLRFRLQGNMTGIADTDFLISGTTSGTILIPFSD